MAQFRFKLDPSVKPGDVFDLTLDPLQISLTDGATSQPITITPPKTSDGIRSGTCLRCGMAGQHATPIACIDALRDRLARWE